MAEEPIISQIEETHGETSSSFDRTIFTEHYSSWNGSTLPDPRRASISDISNSLIEIISVESPIQVSHLLRIYVRGAGIGKLGHQIEAELLKAVDRLVKRGEIEKEAQGKPNDKLNWVVRKIGSPLVRLRPLRLLPLYL